MTLAALTGIGIVLAAAGTFYVGTDFLRAELGQSATASVVITAEGTFEPSETTLRPGDALRITNENPNPQVLKARDENTGIEPQVLFEGENVTLDIPSGMPEGAYVLFSETLPPEQTLTIRIGTEAETDGMIPLDDILIPNLSDIAPETNPVASTDTPAPSAPPNGQSPVLTLHDAAPDAAPETTSFTNTAIPSNPYTVGNELRHRAPPASDDLHGGAPLLPTRPRAQPQTGMSLWLFLILAAPAAVFGFWKVGKLNTKIVQ